MATRSELFRYREQRSHPHAPAVSTAPAAEAHVEERSKRDPASAVYALETSAARPSRKSTRKSANRQKTDVQFRMKRRESEARPRPGRSTP